MVGGLVSQGSAYENEEISPRINGHSPKISGGYAGQCTLSQHGCTHGAFIRKAESPWVENYGLIHKEVTDTSATYTSLKLTS